MMLQKYLLFLISCTCYTVADRIWRLPTNVNPTSYQVKLRPDIDENVFTGSVAITVTVKEHTDKISLHSANLTIENVTVDYEDMTYELDQEHQLLVMSCKNGDTIYAGEHVISIKFQGSSQCESRRYGFCKIPYFYDNREGFIVVSDSEPTYARYTYPCFDEPALKAKFNVKIVTPNDTYIALSNMHNISKLVTSKGVIYDFATTDPLSTYNVAFIVTDFPYREKVWMGPNGPVPVRLYSWYNQKQLKLFPLDSSIRLLEYFSNYTGIAYSFPKLDLIEYRRTTAGSENWGMITVKDGLLSLKRDIFDKRQIILVLAHEIAHMWFGNLVTIEWWSELWLKEGFAQYFGDKSAKDLYRTDLFLGSKFINYKLMMIDRNTSMPLVRPLASIEDIEHHFTDVAYIKGSHILRMIESVMGPEKFQTFIRLYVQKYAHKTVTTGRFIETLEQFMTGISVRSFLESWIYQNRYPLLLVEDDDSGTVFKLRQMSYSCHIENDSANSLQYKWTVPVTYITSNNFTPTLMWFDKDQDSVTLEVSNETRWILFNPSHDGLYRFNYTERMIQRLVDNVDELERNHKNMLLLELSYLFFNGYSSCGPIMRYMKKYETEVPEEDLHRVIGVFNQMKIYLLKHNKDLLPKFYKFVVEVAERNDKLIPEHYQVLEPTGVWLNKTSLMEQPEVQKHVPDCIKWMEENL